MTAKTWKPPEPGETWGRLLITNVETPRVWAVCQGTDGQPCGRDVLRTVATFQAHSSKGSLLACKLCVRKTQRVNAVARRR